jgi:malate/lactate dehydrogenase
MGVKISIIGAGRVGGMIAYLLTPNKKIDEIVLIDVIQPRVEGTILDVSHAYPEYSSKLKAGNYEDTADSKIIIITAGLPRAPETETRMSLLDANKPIMKDIIQSIKVSKDCVVIILTNPVEPLVYLAYKLLQDKLDSKNIIGFSNMLDSARLECILSEATGEDPEKIEGLVIGEHGENMIPVFSACKIDGGPLPNLNRESIKNKLKISSKRVVECLGGTQFGPSRHVERLVGAILNDTGEVFPVSFFIESNDAYNISDVCMSLPAAIGSAGVKYIKKINLNKDEMNSLLKLSEELKKIQKGMGV